MLRQTRLPAVLVSVDSIVGSTPREAGARMIVTAEHSYGTIGGGTADSLAAISPPLIWSRTARPTGTRHAPK